MEAILLGIDGTGVFDKKDYRAEMQNSFVSYIVRRTPARQKKYIRGPGWDGLDMSIIVDNAYAFVRQGLIACPQAPVFLTGYSRGGAGVLGIAERLIADNADVSAMVLFDPVDRSLAISSSEVPINVKHLVYARRDPRASSRNSFGNCGTIRYPGTKVSMRSFWGTHGALGGVPWKAPPGAKATDFISESLELTGSKVSYVQDFRCAQEVWTWVSPQLATLGMLGGKPLVRARV